MSREFDTSVSLREVKSYLAALVARKVLDAKPLSEDVDEACETAGIDFKNWLSELAYDKDFVHNVNSIIGQDEFNSEFFDDGLNRGLIANSP